MHVAADHNRFADGAAGQAAFTLPELLTVMAFVGLLVTLTVPLAQRGLGAAQERACAANLRAWGNAFMLYAGEHNGFLPHPDGWERNDGCGGDAAHPEHDQGYMDVLPPYLGERPWRDYPKGQKPTGGIWQCPGARLIPGAPYNYNPAGDGYFSYAMNSYLAHDFCYGLPWNAAKQPSFLFMGKAVAPATTILMFEQTLDPRQGYGQAGGLSSAGRYAAEDARAVTERHARRWDGLGGNVLYLDGHVAWRNDLWDEKLKNPRIPKRGDRTWFPYDY